MSVESETGGGDGLQQDGGGVSKGRAPNGGSSRAKKVAAPT